MSRLHIAVIALALLALPAASLRAGEPHLDYAVDVSGVLYAVDLEKLTTRALGRVRVGGEAPVLWDLVATPDGYLYGVSATGLYRINIENPAESQKVGEHGLIDPYAAGLGPGGRVFVTTRDGGTYVLDPNTAAATEVGRLGGTFAASGDLAVVDKAFYGTVKTPGRREHLVAVDPQTGRAQPVGPLVDATTGAAMPDVFGLVYRNGRLFGFLLGGPIVTIDPKTARCTVVANTRIGWYGATEYFRL